MTRLLIASFAFASILTLSPGMASAQIGVGGNSNPDLKKKTLAVEKTQQLMPDDDPNKVLGKLKYEADRDLWTKVMIAAMNPPSGYEHSHNYWYRIESGIDDEGVAWAYACADVYFRKIDEPNTGGGPGGVEPVNGG